MTGRFPGGGGFSLLRLAPMVLRARGFRLYARGGGASGKRRLVDLWQNGGAAVLGHTPPSMLRELKNAASRGLFAPFPHFLEDRLAKALSRVFPDRDFALYAAPPPELEALAASGAAGLWRPFLDPAAPLSAPENAPPVLALVVPGVQGWRLAKGPRGAEIALPLGLCALAIGRGFERGRLPPGDFLPPALLAAAARGVHDLVAAAPLRSRPAFPRIAKALRGVPPEASMWKSRGPYLEPRRPVSREGWAALFRRYLDAGFLLPPAPCQPLILPGELSPGEEAKLAGLLAPEADFSKGPLD